MAGRVTVRESVVIDAPDTEVFAFISNGNRDPEWRTEVQRMDVQGPTELGTLMIEYSTFFRFLKTVTPTQIKELSAPTRLVLETPDSHPTWLRSTRTVERLGAGRTRFTYELGFDLAAMKQISPVVPPGSLVTPWYRRRVRRYLNNAKRIIETRPS